MFAPGFSPYSADLVEIVLDVVVTLAVLGLKVFVGAHLLFALPALAHMATRARMSSVQHGKWLLAVLLLPFSGSVLWWSQGAPRFRTARWTKPYICRACGYDCRGLSDEVLCPEC